jgi:hypothetical protein
MHDLPLLSLARFAFPQKSFLLFFGFAAPSLQASARQQRQLAASLHPGRSKRRPPLPLRRRIVEFIRRLPLAILFVETAACGTNLPIRNIC